MNATLQQASPAELDNMADAIERGELKTVILPAYATIHVNGIPFWTSDETHLLGHPNNFEIAGVADYTAAKIAARES